jgi:hypothetical protein
MPEKFAELPSWIFDVEEVSAGVYKVRGVDRSGRIVEGTGTDPYKLLEECRIEARRLRYERSRSVVQLKARPRDVADLLPLFGSPVWGTSRVVRPGWAVRR